MIFRTLLLFAFISVQAWAMPTAAREKQIRSLVASITLEKLTEDIEIRANPKYSGYAESWLENGHAVIEFNPKEMNSLPKSAQNLIILHELGHIWLGHVAKGSATPALRMEAELEADTFSAYAYQKFERVDDALVQFLDGMEKEPTDPPGSERAGIYKRILLTNQ